jgi:hypothetical protein
LEERSKSEYISEAYLGFSSAYLGNLDKAFAYLEKASDNRDPLLSALRYMPYVPQTIRNDVRFQNFIDRIGFP